MGRKIVITSGKGGVGKTTVCVSVGTVLAYMGKKVVLVDGDIGLNNLDVTAGVENKVVYDILDVISSRCRVKQAIIEDRNCKNLHILPSIKGDDKDIISPQSFRSLMDQLALMYDYVLIDCPAGIDMGFHRAVSSANEAIIVTTPNISAIRDADKVVALLGTYELDSLGLVINRIRGDLVMSGEMMSAGDITRLLRVEPIGIIPADDDIAIYMQIAGLPKNSEARLALEMLANNIASSGTKMYDYMEKYRGVMGKLKGRLKRSL